MKTHSFRYKGHSFKVDLAPYQETTTERWKIEVRLKKALDDHSLILGFERIVRGLPIHWDWVILRCENESDKGVFELFQLLEALGILSRFQRKRWDIFLNSVSFAPMTPSGTRLYFTRKVDAVEYLTGKRMHCNGCTLVRYAEVYGFPGNRQVG